MTEFKEIMKSILHYAPPQVIDHDPVDPGDVNSGRSLAQKVIADMEWYIGNPVTIKFPQRSVDTIPVPLESKTASKYDKRSRRSEI